MCAPQSGSLRDVHGVIQRREEGGRRQRWPGGIKGGIKRRETDPASNQFPKCSPLSGTHRDSQSWIEKRSRREETEVTRRRKEGIKRRQIQPVISSLSVLHCLEHTEIHRVG